MPITHQTITAQDALDGLDEIFRDLQTRFHDQWDWMNAHFYVSILKHENEDLKRTINKIAGGSAQGLLLHAKMMKEDNG